MIEKIQITKAQLNDYFEFKKNIKKAIRDVRSRYEILILNAEGEKYKKIKYSLKYARCIDFDGDGIELNGTETWAYGGREDHFVGLDLDLLYSEKAWVALREDIAKDEAETISRKIADENRKQRERKAQFNKLKKEFSE